MASRNRQSRQVKRADARASAKEQQQQARRRLETKRQYTLTDCMKLGRIANILFVVFVVICLIYYYSIANKGNYSIPFEVIAYTTEGLAFAFFTLSVWWLDRLVRQRLLMKVLLMLYLIVEVLLMLLEFHFLDWSFYNGLSLWTTIIHVIFSTGVAFSLLSLDTQSKRMQTIVTLTCCIILAGMFLGLAGYRVYGSILLNAFAYIIFYTIMIHQLRTEELAIDCYGDQARQTAFTSTMFVDSPLLEEPPQKDSAGRYLRRKASALAKKLAIPDEPIQPLTDDAPFAYEFDELNDDYEDDDYDEDETDGTDAP